MNPTEVYAVHAELIGALNGMFEIWLGFTFATVVAIHVAAQSINKWVLGTGITLYLSASYVFLIRYAHTGGVITFLNERLTDAGLPIYPTPGATLSLMTLFVFMFGTIATVVYAVHWFRKPI
jgi:hypothetical protein